MSEARADVLGRVRAALAGGAAVPEVPRDYRGAGAVSGDVVDLFCERVADYRATVRRVSDWRSAVADVCHGRRLAAPAGWEVPGLEIVTDEPPLSARDLDALDGVVTGCELAIAETGTIVLAGGRSGRRALTLVPDYHACIVEAGQVLATVPDAIARLAGTTSPITFVSGPSATSDIELDRVEGVHGPRVLDVFLVEPSSA